MYPVENQYWFLLYKKMTVAFLLQGPVYGGNLEIPCLSVLKILVAQLMKWSFDPA